MLQEDLWDGKVDTINSAMLGNTRHAFGCTQQVFRVMQHAHSCRARGMTHQSLVTGYRLQLPSRVAFHEAWPSEKELTCSSVILQAPQQTLADEAVVVLSRVMFAACKSVLN